MCDGVDCVAGVIAGKAIRMKDWDVEVSLFAAMIDDFNVRGQRDQINHPGWLTRANFCCECGRSLNEENLKLPTWIS